MLALVNRDRKAEGSLSCLCLWIYLIVLRLLADLYLASWSAGAGTDFSASSFLDSIELPSALTGTGAPTGSMLEACEGTGIGAGASAV